MKRFLVILLSVLFIFSLIKIDYFTVSATEKPTLNVSFDQRIELFGTIITLSDFERNSNNCAYLNTVYKMNLIRYFTPYKNHQVFKNYKALGKKISTTEFEEIFLSLSLPPELKIIQPISEAIIDKAGGIENIDEFIELAKSFSNDSNFTFFYNSQREIINSILESVKKTIISNSLVDELENYYGSSQNSYNIILTPLLLFQKDSFIFTNYNKSDLYAVFGLSEIKNGFLNFGSVDDYRYLYLYKWSHAFTDPIINKYHEDIDNLSFLYSSIEQEMKALNINNWQECMNEHIVRSITIRISENNNLITNSEQIIEKNIEEGFIYIKEFLKLLKYYESNRSRYTNLDVFFPVIIKRLSNIDILRIIKFSINFLITKYHIIF